MKKVYLIVFVSLSIVIVFPNKIIGQDKSDVLWLKERTEIAKRKSSLAYELLKMVDLDSLDSSALSQFDHLRVDNWKRIKKLKKVDDKIDEDSLEYKSFIQLYNEVYSASNFGSFWKNLEHFFINLALEIDQNRDSLFISEVKTTCETVLNKSYLKCICSVEKAPQQGGEYWSEDILEKEKLKCYKSGYDGINICQIKKYFGLDINSDAHFDGLLLPCSPSDTSKIDWK